MDILSKCGKVETTILLESGLENQALEGLCVNLFCHFYVHVFMTCLFQDLCHNCEISRAFGSPAPPLTYKCNKFEPCFSMTFLSKDRNQSGTVPRASVAHLR